MSQRLTHASSLVRVGHIATLAVLTSSLRVLIGRAFPTPDAHVAAGTHRSHMLFAQAKMSNLVTDANGTILVWESLGLPQYKSSALAMGYNGDMLLSLSSSQLEDMAYHLGMLPGHRIHFLQQYPTFVQSVQRMRQQNQAAAASRAQANAVIQANGACPFGGAHEWATNAACGIGIRVCRKCFASQ